MRAKANASSNRLDGFVGHDGYGETLGESPHAFNIGAGQRLLNGIDTASLKPGDRACGRCFVSSLVDINPDARLVAERPLDGDRPGYIRQRITVSYLNEEEVMPALGQLLLRLLSVLASVACAEHPEYRDAILHAAAEQGVCREAGRLRRRIHARHFDGALA
jgi:hypothetical protein